MTERDDLLIANIHGHVARLTINRAEKRNAMTLGMWRAFGERVAAWADDPDIRVLVVAGAGDACFCAGNDIKEAADIRNTPEQRAHYSATVRTTYDALKNFPKPTIARISGYCMGGGVELALLCDLQVAAAEAQFAIPPATLGIGYKLTDIQLLLENIPPKRAKQLLFTAERIPAAQALDWGLVSHVVAQDRLDDAVDALAATIAENAPLSVTASKQIVNQATKASPDADLCARLVEACDASEDRKEGERAFAEKRRPRFTGS